MIHSISDFDNINFDGGNLSSDGGSILLSSYIADKHYLDVLSNVTFNDHRKCPVHSNKAIIQQMIERCCLGYFNQKEQDVLRNDPLLKFSSTPASQPTISRFFDRVLEKSNRQLKRIIQKQACNFINENVDDIILDADSTLVTTNGCQEAAAYISHYAEVGYHPLVINEFNTKLLVSSQLRTGSAYSSNGVIEELQGIFPYISRKDYRRVKFRGDSAFYNSELMDYLESMNCTYFIRAKGYKKLQQKVMEKIYRNKIKEFVKNEMEFLISSYSYNLFHMFQWEVLEESDKTITMETYRKKYQKIAVRVSNHSRKISLHFSSAYTCIEKFYRYLYNLIFFLCE